MKSFNAPADTLAGLDTETAASLIAAATDIALVVDARGVIRDVALGSDELVDGLEQTWLGKPLGDTVTVESQPKIDEMLVAAAEGLAPRWRQVNHALGNDAPDLPVLYSAVKLGAHGQIVALGRDVRPLAELQQRLMDVQQSVERDHARLRHLETRFRVLFQAATEPVVIVDAGSRTVLDANPAALELFQPLVGETFPCGFDASGQRAIEELLARVQALGRSEDVTAHAEDGARAFRVRASMFREKGKGVLLMHLALLTSRDEPAPPRRDGSRVLDVLQAAPDGFVLTEPDGRVISANGAFLDLAQLASEEQARNETLDRWLGRAGVDFNVLASNLREHGAVRLFATTLRGEYGAHEDVEISAVSVPDGSEPCLGFVIRATGRRPMGEARVAQALPRSREQLKELVGRVPLKDLVRESTDLVERLCIEAALEMTGDNRASAAEMLGLSRQSLYVKLRRYGFAEAESESG